ncbi:MAG: patatin-like phospholipase family protein [Deltaproteobacteria bacterium]|nr:patatin-like phospholipase family protein [Deltaproteobacteria bacterium]
MRSRPIRSIVLALSLLAGFGGSGCRTYFTVNDAITRIEPRTGYRADRRWSPARSNELLVIVAFSGGGTRAASFAYGVLGARADTHLIDGRTVSLFDQIDHVTGVSGGSFTAAYLGLHGRGIFADFEERFLRRDVQGALILQMLTPWNWVLFASPFFERSDMIARYYDRILFEEATFADLAARNGPLIQINATDLATGSPFSFIQDQFDFLCSDLSTYPISRAVAASSAVPGPMSPLTLRNFAGQCGFVPPPWIGEAIASQRTFSRNYVNAMNLDSYTRRKSRRFIRLIDGGVSDNLGVRGPFESTLLQRAPSEVEREELGPLRHMVLVLVNAATAPEVEWEAIDAARALFDIIDQTTTVQINRYTLETIELLRATFESWQEVAATFFRAGRLSPRRGRLHEAGGSGGAPLSELAPDELPPRRRGRRSAAGGGTRLARGGSGVPCAGRGAGRADSIVPGGLSSDTATGRRRDRRGVLAGALSQRLSWGPCLPAESPTP